ncbi:MAG: dephospho-CoA kinase [Gemmatimonadota bacterium]
MTRVIGLTGNAAGGKTTVAERWRAAGVPVIDADRLGHVVLAEDPAVRAALLDAFGPAILDADGAIDRPSLGEVAFATAEGVRQLNAIVHPPLLERLDAALLAARAAGDPLVVVDAALVFEFGLDDWLDAVVLVTAPQAVREARLRERRGLSVARIRQILAAQQPDDAKTAASDFIIVNDGSREALDAAADRVLAALCAGHGGPSSEGGHDE